MKDSARLRRFAWYLDEALPLPGGYRIGLDGIVGIVPVLGDAVGLAAATWILIRARRYGVPRAVMARMVGNVLLDAVAGSVPLAGDVFDVAFKANRRNIALMEEYLADEESVHRGSRHRLLAAAAAGVLVLALIVLLAFSLIRWLLDFIAS